jgi:hypothetical protein
MNFAIRIAAFVDSSLAGWPRIAVAVILGCLVPLLLWGQSTAWLFSGTNASVTGVNVGIGTASPSAKLDIAMGRNGDAGSSGAGMDIALQWGGTGGGWRHWISTKHDNATLVGNGLEFYVNNSLNSPTASSAPSVGNTRVMGLYGNGNVGVGTTNPLDRFSVQGSSRSISGTYSYISTFWQDSTSYRGVALGYDSADQIGVIEPTTGGSPSQLAFWTWNGSVRSEKIRIDPNGNVGIGTTNPTSKLSVNGTIQAKEVVVNTGWADYVFGPAYRLRPLREVAVYIQQNHHLPEIPSEAEVKEKGIGVGEMQAKLLAKIEELTLHMIQEHERNDRLEEQNRDLQRQIWEQSHATEATGRLIKEMRNSSSAVPAGTEMKQ